MKPHEHKWVFSHSSCCLVLKCSIRGCNVTTTAHRVTGRRPKPGERVEFVSKYSEWIRVVEKTKSKIIIIEKK